MSIDHASGVTITCEIGFATTSGDGLVPLGGDLADIVWTDVSAYLTDGLEIDRGKSTELDDYQTGSCRVMLNNTDRRFDPDNAAGPYYGKLTPGRPIRIKMEPTGSVGVATVEYATKFFGFVDSWQPTYFEPGEGVCVVLASDAFKVLNLLGLRSYWETYVAGTNPTYWFRFDDGDDPTDVYDSAIGRDGGSWESLVAGVGATGSSSTGLIANDSSQAASFDGSHGIRVDRSRFKFDFNNYLNWSIQFWVQTTETAPGKYGLLALGGGETSIGVGMEVDAFGRGRLRFIVGAISVPGLVQYYDSSRIVNDGKPHLVQLEWDWSGTNYYLVDYDPATSAGVSFNATLTYGTEMVVGEPVAFETSGSYIFDLAFRGSIDELTLWNDYTITGVQAFTMYQIGFGTLGVNESTGNRIERIIDIVDWPADGRNISASSTNVQALDVAGKTVLGALKECEAAEAGRLFIDQAGRVKFIGRQGYADDDYYLLPNYTFGDDGTELLFESLTFEHTDQFIYNRAIVSRANGNTAQADDTVSQGKYFIRSLTVDGLISDSDADLASRAAVLVTKYADPNSRIPAMEVLANAARPTVVAAVLGIDLAARIEVNRRPLNDTVISRELEVVGIHLTVDSEALRVSYDLAPVDLAYLILDHATFGQLDSNRLGF